MKSVFELVTEELESLQILEEARRIREEASKILSKEIEEIITQFTSRMPDFRTDPESRSLFYKGENVIGFQIENGPNNTLRIIWYDLIGRRHDSEHFTDFRQKVAKYLVGIIRSRSNK